jgi:hypothetical protein
MIGRRGTAAVAIEKGKVMRRKFTGFRLPIVMGALVTFAALWSTAHSQTGTDLGGIVLGTPLAPARLSEAEAETPCRAWWPGLFQQASRITAQYGSYRPALLRRTPNGLVPYSEEDVWAIRLDGVRVPTLPGPGMGPPQILQHLTCIVEDGTGQRLSAHAY